MKANENRSLGYPRLINFIDMRDVSSLLSPELVNDLSSERPFQKIHR